MELSVAKNLIEKGVDKAVPSQVWADFGAGDGLFTNALTELLPVESKIIALDKDERALKNISTKRSGIALLTVVADLNDLPPLPKFDGIVMANALHYIEDQTQFLLNVKKVHLKKTGSLLLIEYNLEKSNLWVPYPISKNRLATLAAESGFEVRVFPDAVKSKLNSSEIYSALLKSKG